VAFRKEEEGEKGPAGESCSDTRRKRGDAPGITHYLFRREKGKKEGGKKRGEAIIDLLFAPYLCLQRRKKKKRKREHSLQLCEPLGKGEGKKETG